MAAVSVFDDQTTAAIREAMSAARSGRIPEAVSIGERALANGGDSAALNAMLGTLHCQTGNLEAGIRHLRAARELQSSDPVIAANLATALAQQGDYAAALDALPAEIARADPTLRLQRIRAFVAQHADDLATAIPIYETIVAAAPDDWESWNNLGNARRLAGDAEGAVAALERAVEINPDSPPVRLNHAMALGAAGRIEEAERKLSQMAEEFPQDAKPLRELHALLKELGRDEPALDAIEAAVKRAPSDVELLLALASQRLNLLRNEAAEEAYRRVVQIESSNALGNLGLAVVFELTNRTDELSRLAGEAQARGVDDDVLNFIRAFDHRRARRFEEGLAALACVPDHLETARRCHLLGQLEEGAGNHDAAYAAYSRMNEIQSDDSTRPADRASNYRSVIRGQSAILTQEWLRGWGNEAATDDRRAPAFLVGFPRSGTTLLDTMLMGHPGIEVLEEEPTLLKASRILPFEDLPSATDEQIRDARDEYFRVAAEHVSLAEGKLLVDKNPLSMNALPLIRRLFPDARIVLALRHPCDVVFSCYATNFKPNDGMANFLRLDTAAELYDLSFGYFEKARELLGMPVHTIRYESVVVDPEAELRPLLDFFGIDWSDEVLAHQVTAARRGRIKTASYAQVAEPIYKRSAGRWLNYRKHLEPILPVLEPWVARFGYTM
jgi:tetratricopeptide (TPR) repeat protein